MVEKIEKGINIKYALFIILFYAFIFQNVLQQYISFFSYLDELYACVFFPLCLFSILRTRSLKIKKYDLIILGMMIIVIISGLYANISYQYQYMSQVMIDVLTVCKFFLAIYTTNFLIQEFNFEKYKNRIANHCKLVTLLFVGLTVLNYIFGWFVLEKRYGIAVNQLFYSHPSSFVAVCVTILILLCLTDRSKRKNLYIILLLLVTISTLRSKAIAFAFVFLILYFTIYIKKYQIHVKQLLILGIIAIVIGFGQIQYYFFNTKDDSARAALLQTSFKIAKEYFPIGTGFGTFGSHVSGENYSPVYSIYGIEDTYGLIEASPDFISDSFWPMIIGQFGVIGTLCYVIALWILFLKNRKTYNKDAIQYYFAGFVSMLYLLISSTAEAAFVNSLAIPFAIIISIANNNKIKIQKEKQEVKENYFET